MIFGDFSEWTAQNLVIRIIAAVVLGGVIGLDRGMKHRGAGTKTITVVCLASALVMLTEQYIQIYFPGLANMNRLAAQVISGIGLAVGIGFIDGGVLITMVMLVFLHVLPFVERFVTRKSHYCNVIIDMEESRHLQMVIHDLRAADIEIDSMEISAPRVAGDNATAHLVLHTKKAMEHMEIYEIITKSEKVVSVDFLG